METSKSAVEAYKKTRLVDFVIQDDDKIAPIYRLDEICEMLRTSSSDMVREVVEYSMKRLDGRSPRVKQKVLRMIKYTVGKGGPEFKRQMQRQAAAIRQLFEYKGQPDVLRGDALNKAVRDTAHEAINAIFASDDKSSQSEELKKRIMGFGNTNYDMHTVADAKKPSLTNVVSDVLEFGSASLKQGLTIISEYSGANIGGMRSDVGSYRGPGLTKSLTSERGSTNRFEPDERWDSRQSGVGMVTTSGSGGRSLAVNAQDMAFPRTDTDSSRGRLSLEERLLDTITTPGKMRLQPTRESLQKFLEDVVKLDKSNLCYALENKLYSPAWQVRFKTLCVLEAIVRQRNEEFFGAIADFFEENTSSIHDCLQLPQATLKDKASKLLNQLGVSSKDSSEPLSDGVEVCKDGSQSNVHDMPDLIDTGETDLSTCEETASQGFFVGDGTSSVSTATGDLLGEALWTGDTRASTNTDSDDTFTGVSFHTPDRGTEDMNDNLFSGLSLNKPATEDVLPEDKKETRTTLQPVVSDNLMDLLSSVSLNDSQNEASHVGLTQNGGFFGQPKQEQVLNHGDSAPFQISGNAPNSRLAQVASPFVNREAAYFNAPGFHSLETFPNYQVPMFVQQNYGQQLSPNSFPQAKQFASGAVGLRGPSTGLSGMSGGTFSGLRGSGRAIGDGFDFGGDSTLRSMAGADSEKREISKAFDFISDHVSAARTVKKSS